MASCRLALTSRSLCTAMEAERNRILALCWDVQSQPRSYSWMCCKSTWTSDLRGLYQRCVEIIYLRKIVYSVDEILPDKVSSALDFEVKAI